MKRYMKRVWALLLAVILSFSVALPGMAADPSLSESRTENAVRFNPAFKFYDRWSVPGATGFEWFTVPFDSASGVVMFCVDPGVNASSNPKNYEVFLGTGDSKLDEIMTLAQRTSKLRNLKNANNKNEPADPEWGVTSEVLEEISPDRMELIVKAISVLHYYAGEGIYGPPTAGEAYNLYDVYAVQCMIWFMCNPNSPGLWFPLGGLSEAEASKVQAAYSKIIDEAKRLFGETVSSFKLETGQYSKDSQAVSEQKALSLGKDGVKDYTLDEKSKKDWELIKYVTVDGTTVQAFGPGSSVSTGSFTITNTGSGFHVEVADEEDTGVYTVRFLTTDTIPDDTKAAGEDWAVYAQAGSRYQSYFSAYQAPKSANLFLSFQRKANPDIPVPEFPAFSFEQVKLDSVGGSDGSTSTPIGDTGLDASFTVDWRTDLGETGTADSMADQFGQGAVAKISPWGQEGADPELVATKTEETALWPEDVGEPAEGEDPVEQEEYVRSITWEARCTVTVTETGVPEGRDGTNTSYTHTIVYRAYTERNSPEEAWPDYTYTITVDGRDTGLTSDGEVEATWDTPYDVTQATGKADEFVNRGWIGVMQIIKTKDSDDIFSLEHGQGTVAGGAGAGKEYSTGSEWTVQLVSGGLEGQPYIKVVEDPAMQATTIGQLMHCYKVMLDGSGTPADEAHPLTPSSKGQIYISNLPYGTYLVTEHRADADRYVLESYLVTIGEDGQVVSTTVNNRAKKNVVTLVKVDSETGKRVPSAQTAFRIKYLGSPEYADPSQTPGYGKYLPNASSITAEIAGADDYIFYTDATGACTIPYELPYGSYRLEELVLPEGYYVGKYDRTGAGSTVDGSSDAGFENRVSIYDDAGNRVDYTAEAGMIYNYYSFAVTEQAAHLDGKGYELRELTVELSNTASKGRIEITKLGEKLAGFRAGTDLQGHVLYEPVWQKAAVSGVTFGIYAARDILLSDGEEPPTAYDAETGGPIRMSTESMSHGSAVAAEVIRRGVHESGAEIKTTIERSTEHGGEENQSTTEYLTPTRSGAVYTARFRRYDADAGLTYEYELTFGLEYTAGGWTYTDVDVVRTMIADDYTAWLPDEMPVVESGGQIVDYETDGALASGNLLEVLANAVDGGLYGYNEYDVTGNDYQLQAAGAGDLSQIVPEIPESEKAARLLDLPALPAGYTIQSIRAGSVTIGNGTVGQEQTAVYREDADASAAAGEPVRSVVWVPVADLAGLADFDPQKDYYTPKYDLTGLTVKGAGGAPLDFGAYGYTDVRLAYASGSTVYVTQGEDETLYGVYYKGSQGLDGSAERIDELKLIPADEEVSLGGYDGPDPAGYPLPEGYEFNADAFGYFTAYNEAEDAYMVFVREGDGTYRWIHCGADYGAYKVRRQAVHLKLTQPADSAEGWTVRVDGVVLENLGDSGAGSAKAVIRLPYEAQPVVTESVGYKVTTAELPGGVGTETTVEMRVPEAPVYFELTDGSRVELTYQGGYTKTLIRVPEGNSLPTILFDGVEVDYLDRANGGLTPARSSYEVSPGGTEHYIRTTRHEAVNGSKAWYGIELVSNAGSETEPHFEVRYRGTYRSVSLVTAEGAEAGTMRGLLRLSSVYRTLRYAQGDLVERVTTGADGKAVSSLLPLGEYEVAELSVPNGLAASKERLAVSLVYENQYTPLVWADVTASNDAVQVQLDLLKGFQQAQNGTEYEPGAGAVFGIYSNERLSAEIGYTGAGTVESSIAAGTLVALITTGADGKAIETVKLPRGDYYVQELDPGRDGYQTSADRYLFRAEDGQAGALSMKWAAAGIVAKVSQKGYGTVEVEVVTLPQLPMPGLVVNGVRYDTSAALAAGSAGELCTVGNAVTGSGSVFTVTGTIETGAVVLELANGAVLTVEPGETGYRAAVKGAAAETETGAGVTEAATAEGGTEYRYEPPVTQTGYTATATAPYVSPQTVLKAENGTTLRFEYDVERGIRKAVLVWPEGWQYYGELPKKAAAYRLGDLDRSGVVDETDAALLEAGLNGAGALTEVQSLLADLDRDGAVTAADLTALREAIAQDKATAEVTVQEAYLPADAILFETGGFGNVAYGYAEVDEATRTVRVDLSAVTAPVTVTVGEAVATLSADSVTLTGGVVSASNGATGEVVGDGLQADGLTLAGSTLTSKDRSLSLSAAGGTSRTELEVDYTHSTVLVKAAAGAAVSAVKNGAAIDAAAAGGAGILVKAGDSVLVKYADGSVHRVSLSENGSVELSVEGLKAGTITGTEGPRLWADGSESGFMDANRAPITQEAIMDATSLDGIRYRVSQSVTLSRSDGFSPLYQIRVNAGGMVKNDLKLYVTKTDAATGKALAGARLEISDRTGAVIAAGLTDAEGRFWFENPGPGEYICKETVPPAGYRLNEEPIRFTVTADGRITGMTELKNEPERDTPDEPAPVTVAVRKVWQAEEGTPRPRSVKVELLRGGVVYDSVTLSRENDWRYEWTGLRSGDWSVREAEVPEGYTSEVSRTGNEFTITNTYRAPKTVEVSARKVWVGDEPARRPESVIVELLLDGVVQDAATLSAANDWQCEWTGLPEGDWSVRERPSDIPAGYTSSVSRDGMSFTITNTYTEEEKTVPVTVRKVWTGDEGVTRPTEVEVELLLDGVVYDRVTLKAETGWTHTWLSLSPGNWSVREAEVPAGYSSEVRQDGTEFIVENTYIPQTGDDTGRWLLAAAACCAGLAWLWLRDRKNKGEN